jgi:hypothetical protein
VCDCCICWSHPDPGTGCVGRPPYYGSGTKFYGDDAGECSGWTDQQEAERALVAWAAVDPDALVLAAVQAGISKVRIHELSGLARTTIDRIVNYWESRNTNG